MEDNNLDAAGLDVLDNTSPDVVQEPQPSPPDTGGGGAPEEPSDDSALIREMLSRNGITNPEQIRYEDEQGQETTRSWNSFSKDEKMNILSSIYNTGEVTEYSQDEIDLINQIRQSNQSPAEYLSDLQQKASQATQDEIYEVDQMTDDELFVLNALDIYGNENVSDEQLEKLLADAKSDPELYQKNIESLRAQYKRREDELQLQKQQELKAQQENEFNAFSTQILNEIQSWNQLADQPIELSVDDMNDLANFLLTRDEEGNTEFGKVMDNPKVFTQAAFWVLKGNDIMNEISGQIKAAYNKGLADGKKGQSPLVFTNNKDKKPGLVNDSMSANALDVS